MPPCRTTAEMRDGSMPDSRATIESASSEVSRCWASKSAGTYSASITGVIGSTFNSRTEPPEARESDTAVSIAALGRSVSARPTGTRIRLNICLYLFLCLCRIGPDQMSGLARHASARGCGNPARGDESIEPPGLAVQLAPGVARKIDHRQRG